MPSTFQVTVSILMLLIKPTANLLKSGGRKNSPGFYLCLMERIFTLSAIHQLAAEIWSAYPTQKIFCFSGQLGAGKTTLIHALCKAKKVEDTVSSPTFSIINEYAYPGGTIYHIDLYRVKDEEEAIRAGVEDCLDSGGICLVEWPERAMGIFPPGSLQLRIETIDKAHRKIQVNVF